MKKITFFICAFFMSGLSIVTAQHSFAPQGPETVANGAPVTVSINDMANTAAVPAGLYDAFSVSADWSEIAGGPYSSEADLTITTTAGSVDIDPPTSGSATDAVATTLVFSGDLAGVYDPSTDGFIEIVLNQSWTGTSAEWTNIVVTLFEVPSCEEPIALDATNVTTTTADLSWTAGAAETLWNIELVDITAGGTVTGAPTFTGVSNPYIANGLTPDTEYEFYVQADCDTDGTSIWSGPFMFRTACTALMPDYTADMSINLPDTCWDEASSGDPTTGPMDLGASDWRQGTSYAIGDSNAINLYSNNDSEWLLSPTFDLSTGGPFQLEVNVAVTDWQSATSDDSMGSDDEVQLLMTTDDGATWTNITTWNAGNEPPAAGIEYVEDLTALTGNVMFAIWATDGTVDDTEDYDFHVGKFRVRAIPACSDPSALMVSNVMSDSADFSWMENGTASSWDIELVDITAAGTASGTPTTAGTTENPFTISGLVEQNDYEVYVRAICGGDTSEWIGPLSFTTPCSPIATDYSVDMSANVPDACWNEAGSGEVVDGPMGMGDSDWIAGRAFTDLDSNVIDSNVINLYQSVDREWLISPVFDLDALGAVGLLVQVAVTDYCFDCTSDAADTDTMGSDDEVQLLMTADGGTTWTNLTTWNVGNQPDVTGTNFIVDLTGMTGNVQFAFFATDGETDDLEDYDFHVGNFVVNNTVLSTTQYDNLAAFTYYPNPVKNTLILNAQNTIEQVVMYNMIGQEVLRAIPNSVDSDLDMSQLETGTYFVKVTIANSTETVRVIKE
ncbi:fibronectin type III domain-containing protein [Winogradskyella forsetii]|uniref:fibronectin type III domain-containing protein n=1 Tax=Winogradskyella forsetii TaxID=2686077 RepID=UPI0015BCCC16|nr:fibronectin type III domain-containing protein [Winogradskyella forsetii]